jgi:hypothetical protein
MITDKISTSLEPLRHRAKAGGRRLGPEAPVQCLPACCAPFLVPSQVHIPTCLVRPLKYRALGSCVSEPLIIYASDALCLSSSTTNRHSTSMRPRRASPEAQPCSVPNGKLTKPLALPCAVGLKLFSGRKDDLFSTNATSVTASSQVGLRYIAGNHRCVLYIPH